MLCLGLLCSSPLLFSYSPQCMPDQPMYVKAVVPPESDTVFNLLSETFATIPWSTQSEFADVFTPLFLAGKDPNIVTKFTITTSTWTKKKNLPIPKPKQPVIRTLSYDDTPEGFEKFVNDMYTAIKTPASGVPTVFLKQVRKNLAGSQRTGTFIFDFAQFGSSSPTIQVIMTMTLKADNVTWGISEVKVSKVITNIIK